MGRTQFFARMGWKLPTASRGSGCPKGRRVIVAGRDDDMLRLITVIDRQRRELDRVRASVAEIGRAHV